MSSSELNIFKRLILKWVDFLENRIPFIKRLFERKQYAFAFFLYKLIRILQNAYFGKREIQIRRVKSVKEYAEEQQEQYSVIIPSKKVNCFGPDFTHKDQLKGELEHPEVYYACLKNIKVVGNFPFLLDNSDNIILDVFNASTLHEIDYHDVNVPFMDQHRVVLDRFIPEKKERKIPIAINLCGKAMNNYYHLMIETIPKISLFANLPESLKNAPVLLDSGVKTYPQLLELLDTYLPDNHERIYIDSLEMIEVEELIVLSPLAWFPYYGKDGMEPKYKDYIFHPQAISFLRNAIEQPIKGERKIYLSRKSSKFRKFNESEIANAVKELGFEIVYTEQLTFHEQIQLFQSAKFIIGATGAAFTNLVFCNKNTDAIILAAVDWDFGIFSNIAIQNGVNLKYLVSKTKTNQKFVYHSPFETDVNKLVEEYNKLEQNAATKNI